MFSFKIASRSSPLALAQIEEIVRELKAQGVIFKHEVLKLETSGDKDKTTPLTQALDNFFTDTIDQALLEGRANIAIHSAKDLPQHLHKDLKIFALTKGLDDKDAWVGRTHWKDLPSRAKVGTSSILRQAQILQARPDVTIVNIRGTIEERLELVKKGSVDGIVVAACALKRLELDKEIKDIFPWEGMALQGQLAIVGRQNDHELANLFSAIDIRRHYGTVTLVGAGPGDCELITIKGVKALETADCVFYDYLVDAELLKYAPQAEHIFAGKRKGAHSLSQEELSRMLKEKAMTGKKIVRLKGGDPLVFGRGADEIQYLRAYHIAVDVIPGISSATGIPSSLGIPLTARGVSSSVAFLSAHEEDEENNQHKLIKIPEADTLVFLMGLTKLGIIVESLRKAGWPKETPMMIISNGTKPQEQIVKGTISSIEGLVKEAGLKPPALILAGNTVEFYKAQKTFLHCGTHPELYRHLGKIISWPMIEIKPVSMGPAEEKKLLQNFEAANIIVLTSWYAVEYFVKTLRSVDPDVDFTNKICAVIGRRTQKALHGYNILAGIVSTEETAEGLLKAITKHTEISGKRILFPRSSLPNPFLKDALIAKGASIDEVTIYLNTKPAKRDLPSIHIDGVIFTSPSTVRNFLADYGRIPDSWAIMSKGPVTLKTLHEAGYTHAASLS